jgi:hypothetical protein
MARLLWGFIAVVCTIIAFFLSIVPDRESETAVDPDFPFG